MEKQAAESPLSSERATVDVVAILKRRKGWLVLSCILGLGVGVAYYFLSPKRYESRAELLLMQNEAEQMNVNSGSERSVSEELLATHMKLVQSPRIVLKALQVPTVEAKALAVMDSTDEPSSTEEADEEDRIDRRTNPTDATSPTDATPSGEVIQGLTPAQAVQAQSKSETLSSASTNAPESTPSTTESQPKEPSGTKSDAAPASGATTDESKDAPVAPTGTPAEAATGSTGEVIAGLDPSAKEHTAPDGETEGSSEAVTSEEGQLLASLPSILANLSIDGKPSDYVINNLYVTSGGTGRARNAHVLNIAFRHTSPEDAELVTRAIVHQYREFVKSKFKDINTEAAGLIRDAKLKIESEIKEMEAGYKSFRAVAPMLTRGASGTDIHTARYEELSAELSQLAIQRDEAAGRLEMVRSSLAEFTKTGAHNLQKLALIDERNAERLGILVTVERGKAETAAFQSTQPERMAGATAEYSQLLTMKTRLSQLTDDFGPEYPEVKSLRQQIAEMENFLAKKSKQLFVGEEIELTPDDVMRAYVSMLDHDLRALDQRSKDVQRQMDMAAAEAKKLIDFQLEDEGRIRARERQEQLYDAVIERLRDINLREQQSPLILELIKEPTVGEKVEPKSVIAAAISMVCALLIGGIGVLVAELGDRSVHSPEEFEQMLDARVLAHLPNFQNDPEIRKVQRQSRRLKSPLSPSLLTYYAPDSRASETFRALRTQVMFSAGGDHRILVTTSASQGAGKSMLSSNMAVSMASLGAEVLLIDCDMRLPQVHRLFGVSNETGLADAIAHPDKVDEYLKPSTVAGLTLLTSGQSPANPAELLSRPECKELLEQLRSRYSYIILDCPPVLAVSDPSILAPLSDGVLFVSTVDGESRPKTERCKRILEGVGAKVLGIVVNRSDESSQRYGYQSYGYESNSEEGGYYASRPAR